MNPSTCPAAKLLETDRINLAILALVGTATISDLAAGHDVSRKFVYQQAYKARAGLAEVFASSLGQRGAVRAARFQDLAAPADAAITPICHGSYRGVVELMRDVLGVRISVGTIRNVHQGAARQAGAINRGVELAPIRVGWHDETCQGRSSAVLKNPNSRLRNYFTLRRPLGGSYLDPLQFFLDHRCFLRSRVQGYQNSTMSTALGLAATR
jgi:hypothetical protein